MGVGIYTQISDSFHVYTGNPQWDRIKNLPYSDFNPYKYDVQPMPIMDEPAAWDEDLKKFMAWVDDNDSVSFPPKFINEWFTDVPLAMYHVWQMHKQHRAGLTMVDAIEAEDWRMAAIQWLEERE